MLLYIEQMQTQQRIENGVREKIVGYLGDSDWEPDADAIDPSDMAMMAEVGTMMEAVNVDHLPDDIKWIYKAEQHRLKTGEIMTVQTYKEKYG